MSSLQSTLSEFDNLILIRFGLEGTLPVSDIVKSLYPSSTLTEVDLAQLVIFDPDLHMIRIQTDRTNPSKLLKLQVFQKVFVNISVEEAKERQSIRKLVMSLKTDANNDEKVKNVIGEETLTSQEETIPQNNSQKKRKTEEKVIETQQKGEKVEKKGQTKRKKLRTG